VDIRDRLKGVVFTKVTPDLSSLSENEKQAMMHCVRAARVVNEIYLRQVSPNNIEIRRALETRSDKEGLDLLKYFNVHGSPWDAFDNDTPFIPGVGPRPLVGPFYPPNLTKEEWTRWIDSHPDERVKDWRAIIRP